MTLLGSRIDETGTLILDGDAFHFRCDLGRRYRLELRRTPGDLGGQRVRLIGTLVGTDLVSAEGVTPV